MSELMWRGRLGLDAVCNSHQRGWTMVRGQSAPWPAYAPSCLVLTLTTSWPQCVCPVHGTTDVAAAAFSFLQQTCMHVHRSRPYCSRVSLAPSNYISRRHYVTRVAQSYIICSTCNCQPSGPHTTWRSNSIASGVASLRPHVQLFTLCIIIIVVAKGSRTSNAHIHSHVSSNLYSTRCPKNYQSVVLWVYLFLLCLT